MKHLPFAKLALTAALGSLVFGPAAVALEVEKTYVGTWTSDTGSANNPGSYLTSGKYVIQTVYDTDDIVEITDTDRNNSVFFGPDSVYHVDLSQPGNAYNLFLPSEGAGLRIKTKTAANHFPIGPGFAPSAEIQFFDVSGTQFRGFEFESDFLDNGMIFEQYTSDANNGGTTIVTNHTAQMLNSDFSLTTSSNTVDVLSDDVGPSGGQQNPGVFFSEANPLVANAGSDLVYSATILSHTTDAGTVLVAPVPDPIIPGDVRTAPSTLDEPLRHADNDLGAGRSDGDDFLNFEWMIDGVSIGHGDQLGTRLNREVSSAGALHFVNNGQRAVDDVNIMRGIADSGLTNTVDTAEWSVTVTEDITLLSHTDSLTVSYENSGPIINSASATPSAEDLTFDLQFDDEDLAINVLIPDFEVLSVDIKVDSIDFTGFFANLINVGSQFVNNADLVSNFGVGVHTFAVTVADLAGEFDFSEFQFTVVQSASPVSAPASIYLIMLTAVGALSRRRRATTV